MSPLPPRVRRPGLDFTAVPRDWLFDCPVATTYANGLHLVFPAGERFFIRSVRARLHCVDDLDLKARVRGFVGQEAMHGRAHEDSFRMMERHGYSVTDWLEGYERVAYGWLEPRVPLMLRLSVTVALEHLTATLGENALHDDVLDRAHPTMRRLLRWHAAEEIEHKSVAFDVYRAAGGGYWLRVLGMVVALAGLLWFWSSAVRHLRRQDPRIDRQAIAAARARHADAVQSGDLLKAAFFDYLRPGFHPDDHDSSAAARMWLTSAGMAV